LLPAAKVVDKTAMEENRLENATQLAETGHLKKPLEANLPKYIPSSKVNRSYPNFANLDLTPSKGNAKLVSDNNAGCQIFLGKTNQNV
jgi:hypothetical protein